MVKMSDYSEMEAALAGLVVAGPVEEAVIAEAEQSLGVRFPPSYRFFLSKFGAAFGQGLDLAGLFVQENQERPPLWVHVVDSTHELRHDSGGAIPKEYVPVSGDGCDLIYYIDTGRANADGESPLVALGPGADDLIIADSFLDYVVRTRRGRITH
jgi:hypothetical protein